MSTDDQSLRHLVIGAGGDAFLILSTIFAVLLVTANFQPSASENPQSQETTKELKKELSVAKKRLQSLRKRLREMDISLTGSSSGPPSTEKPVYVYLERENGIVVEKGKETRSVKEDRLQSTLQSLQSEKVIILAKPEVASGRVTRLVGQVKNALPDASTSLGTLKQ